MTKEIYMNHRVLGTLTVLVDDEDYDILSRHSWFVRSTTLGKFYATTTLPTRMDRTHLVSMHYFIMGVGNIDHRSGNTLDNRKENLRKATHQQNGWNKGKPKRGRHGKPTSQFKGVTRLLAKNGSVNYRVIIKATAKGVKPAAFIRLGPFGNEVEAAMAYNREIVKLRGEFAWVNPIPV